MNATVVQTPLKTKMIRAPAFIDAHALIEIKHAARNPAELI
jgi:hypothetical protein